MAKTKDSKTFKEVCKSLNDTQKAFIIANWDKLTLKELTQQVFNDPKLHGGGVEGQAIRAFLVERMGEENVKKNLKTTKYVSSADLELTEEQKIFIENNTGSMRPLEIARTIFNDMTLTPLNKETLAVVKYYKQVAPGKILPEEDASGEYQPITSISRLVVRVNKYLQKNSDPLKKYLDPDNLKQAEIRNLNALWSYMRNYRFIYQITQYQTELDRELFESSFIEFLYNKPDCLEEDVHNYISLCAEIVAISQIERLIQLLNEQYHNILSGNSDEKMSVTLAETIDKQRARQKDAKDRYEKLMKMLVEDRSKRVEQKMGGATLYNMVNLWKQEETRKKIIDRADDINRDIDKEVERLSNLDALKAEIYGLDENSIGK